jgi:large conductance mechanosensitive channel
MGVAFATVVTSLVEHVLMPIIAVPFGQPNFSDLTLTVNDSVIMWGAFVTAVVTFLLTALAVFLFVVKPYNAFMTRFAGPEEETGPTEIDLLTEIRDSLRTRS